MRDDTAVGVCRDIQVGARGTELDELFSNPCLTFILVVFF